MNDERPTEAASAARRRDPERTKAALLDAARTEFAAKGLAGARVNEIAERAGVNKQLITYHFGGKDGLHRALADEWVSGEREIADATLTLEEVAAGYVQAVYQDRDLGRIRMRQLLDQDPAATDHDPDADEVAHLRARRDAGEITDELDPAFVLLLLQSVVMSGFTFPADTKRYFGTEPGSPEHLDHLLGQLRVLIGRIGAAADGA